MEYSAAMYPCPPSPHGRLLALAVLATVLPGSAAMGQAADVVLLPVRYAADRFYVAPVTTAGDTIRLYTDTGGGANMLYRDAVARLGLSPDVLVLGGDSARVVALPVLRAEAAIPLPNLLPPFGDRLLVRSAPPHTTPGTDGFLGRTWFAGRVWQLDYPDRSLGLVMAYEDGRAEHRVPLGFQTDAAGHRTTHFPRVQIVVEGDTIEMLFDTGATVHLTSAALDALADQGPAQRGTSFITQAVFSRWRERHPRWRVIEQADSILAMPMIEVPEITVAGYTVGPVWFTMRPDENFHGYMSQWMDRQIDGAVGGSALRFFRILVDYPRGTASFARP